MSSGYRNIVAALAGLAALCTSLGAGAYFGSLYGPDRKHYEAVGSDTKGNGDYRGPSQSLPDVAGLPGPVERAIANPPSPTAKDHESRDLAAQEASALWAFWMVVISSLSALITLVGTILLYKQIILTREAVEDTGKATEAMLDANEIARNSAVMENRAHMVVESPYWQGNNAQGFQFGVRWQNVGKTVTRRMRTFTTHELRGTKLPIDFAFNDEDPGAAAHGGPGVKSFVSPPTPQPFPIPPGDIAAIANETKFLYVYGWAKYFDIFPGTPQRVTRFCYRAMYIGEAGREFIFPIFDRHNCSDEGCDDE